MNKEKIDIDKMNSENKTTIETKISWFRPYIIDGKELNHIVIYNDGKEVFKTVGGWFEHLGENKIRYDVKRLTIGGEIKKAIKENLFRKDNYIIRDKEDTFQKRYILYIHEEFIPVETIGEQLHFETPTKKQYHTLYKLNVPNTRREISHLDKVTDKAIYEDTHHNYIIETGNYRTVKTNLGETVEELYNRFKEDNINISLYDTEKLLDKYNISIKS